MTRRRRRRSSEKRRQAKTITNVIFGLVVAGALVALVYLTMVRDVTPRTAPVGGVDKYGRTVAEPPRNASTNIRR